MSKCSHISLFLSPSNLNILHVLLYYFLYILIYKLLMPFDISHQSISSKSSFTIQKNMYLVSMSMCKLVHKWCLVTDIWELHLGVASQWTTKRGLVTKVCRCSVFFYPFRKGQLLLNYLFLDKYCMPQIMVDVPWHPFFCQNDFWGLCHK